MRRFQPLYLAAAVAIALSGSAIAQTTTGSITARTAPSTASSTTVTTTSPTPGISSESNTSQMTLMPTPSTQPGSSSGSAQGSNQVSVDPATTRPGSFEPGGAFGPPGSTTTTTTVPATLPGTTGALVLPATGADGMPLAGNQQTVVIQQPQPQSQARSATPIFDEVAREGRAKERQRRAQGNEPRIYGIAPRTDRDLTHQMPDDPIIRY